MQQFLET